MTTTLAVSLCLYVSTYFSSMIPYPPSENTHPFLIVTYFHLLILTTVPHVQLNNFGNDQDTGPLVNRRTNTNYHFVGMYHPSERRRRIERFLVSNHPNLATAITITITAI